MSCCGSSQFQFPSAADRAAHYPQLQQWFESQWADFPSIAGPAHAQYGPVPAPIVALDEDQVLAGGLAFAWFVIPNMPEAPAPPLQQVWINGVLVAPQHRRVGLASRLVSAAEREASAGDIQRLFVRTQYPVLYERLGWRRIHSEGDDHNLIKALS